MFGLQIFKLFYAGPEDPVFSRGGMHSQASYWFSIGFKQMVCTVATCYWYLALLWFYKTWSFLSVVEGGYITTGSLLPKFFFYLYWQLLFLNILGNINSKLLICNKKFKKLLVKELCSCRKQKTLFQLMHVCGVCMISGWGEGVAGEEENTHFFIICLIKFDLQS